MNNLVILSERGNPITNSLLVAEKFEKEHKHVLDAVRNLTAENPAAKSYFWETSYESRGKYYPMYLMTRDGFSLLVMGFTGSQALKFKIDFIEAFNTMEQKLKAQFSLPQTFSEALQLAADQAKQIELQQSQINSLAPKAEIFDKIHQADNCLTMNQVAKSVGWGRNNLMEKLRNSHILMKNNTPYQEYISAGYFVVRVHPVSLGNKDINYTQTFMTGKGLTWLTKYLSHE